MKFPFDPGFGEPGDDDAHLHLLGGVRARPVLITGLHRSGTTFLYDTLASTLPVAQLTLYDLFYFNRRLSDHVEGREDEHRATLDKLFDELGIVDRKIDTVRVRHDTVEEYGWLLRSHSPNFHVSARNRAVFGRLCRTLTVVQPGTEAALLKNPFDTGKSCTVAGWFPEARFVFIGREPIDILHSLFNATMTLLGGEQPFLDMLIDRLQLVGGARVKGLPPRVWKGLGRLRGRLGEDLTAQIIKAICVRAVVNQIVDYRRDLRDLPPSVRLEVSYPALVADPAATVTSVADFLGLDVVGELATLTSSPRESTVHPVLEGAEPELQRRLSAALAKAGLA